ncbi:MAG: hypothetical protein D9V47_10370 [Clostridia bacterium]|nr:MAG: hypothetical protein D9V47_10370 [Clostridia bacterium]
MKEILDAKGWRLCRTIGASPLAPDFYLAGGTGLALQLRHRRSLDLDFFAGRPAERIATAAIIRTIQRLFGPAVTIELSQADQVTWNIGGTMVTFMAYPFPLLEPLVPGERISRNLAGLSLASPGEIALMKAYSLGRRATFRDYVDLYFLLQRQIVTLQYILEAAPRKFVIGGERVFSPRLFLEQLTYTRDLDDRNAALELVLGKSVTASTVEEFLRTQVRGFLESRVLERG